MYNTVLSLYGGSQFFAQFKTQSLNWMNYMKLPMDNYLVSLLSKFILLYVHTHQPCDGHMTEWISKNLLNKSVMEFVMKLCSMKNYILNYVLYVHNCFFISKLLFFVRPLIFYHLNICCLPVQWFVSSCAKSMSYSWFCSPVLSCLLCCSSSKHMVLLASSSQYCFQ